MDSLVWALLVLLLGLLLIILEMFIPSAGILTFLAAAAVITSVVIVFVYEPIWIATLFLAAVTLLVPTLAAFLVKWWPRTPIGRRILNLPPMGEQHDSESDRENQLAGLVGQTGWSQSKMLPSGVIQIAGRNYDAISEGLPIERGQMVEVIQVRRNMLVVRPAEKQSGTRGPATSESPAPLETVVPDPFDDSLS
jgi:membrane-bound serine protease (ClpP class)